MISQNCNDLKIYYSSPQEPFRVSFSPQKGSKSKFRIRDGAKKAEHRLDFLPDSLKMVFGRTYPAQYEAKVKN